MRRSLFLLLLILPCLAQARSPLVIAPYLQVGPNPSPRTMEVWWAATEGDYSVRYRSQGDWRSARPVAQKMGNASLYHARLTELQGDFDYQLLKGNESIFSARGKALKPRGAPCRFTVVGDTACGTPWEKETAYQMQANQTDCTVILGDIVYNAGRISEYRQFFFPIYNSSQASPKLGAPLLRSVPFLAAPGNHDFRPPRGAENYQDGFAYFLFWSQPLNGPATTRPVYQPAASRTAFTALAGERYPRMGSFSIDVGDVHWTVLDSNPANDWSRPEMRQWLKTDLAEAAAARWRFVALHHSPFSSGEHHFREQHMRTLAEVFEQGKVDVVFGGHMHNYQRTRPLRFRGASPRPDGTVTGSLALDKAFDGVKNTRPQGVIYLVDGGGGAYLHDSGPPPALEPYTVKMESNAHSFTVLDVKDDKATFRQVTSKGKEIDRFVLER